MSDKDNFETGCKTLISMLNDHLLNGKPIRRTVVSNLKLFTICMEQCLDETKKEGDDE